MSEIKNLEPKEVWAIFDEITRVPRPSKKEEKIREYLREFASTHSLELQEDKKGNIVIRKAASEGCEHLTPVIMQSHVDMVCEKEPTSTHNFETDPIETYIEDGWVKARGTTLGADCGIGMALQMAVLVAEGVKHPAIEALFTVDEEMGLTGAMDLGEGMLNYKRMINLDSEDEGEIFIGCAGGIDTLADYEIDRKALNGDKYELYKVRVTGLKGGHSGDDINKGRANANRVLGRTLRLLTEEHEAKLCWIDGGNLRNAIAREAVAVVALRSGVETIARTLTAFRSLSEDICEEYSITEPTMSVDILCSEDDGYDIDPKVIKGAFTRKFTSKMLSAVLGVQNGVVEYSASMPGLVETSTNLASIKVKDEVLQIVTSQRSSVQSARDAVAASIAAIFRLSGAEVRHTDGYPGWKPNPSSPFVKASADLYREMFGEDAKVKAIHAGLECGLFLTKYPELDIISIGPTLRDVHSPSERLHIEALEKSWRYLKQLLLIEV